MESPHIATQAQPAWPGTLLRKAIPLGPRLELRPRPELASR